LLDKSAEQQALTGTAQKLKFKSISDL